MKTPLMRTRQSLGVPDWFICDGCSHAPDSVWLTPCCNLHDYQYFIGSTRASRRARRKQSNKELRANIKHNAKHSPGSWLKRRWRPWLGESYYWATKYFGVRSWRLRERDDYSLAEIKALAIAEGKYDPRGDESLP